MVPLEQLVVILCAAMAGLMMVVYQHTTFILAMWWHHQLVNIILMAAARDSVAILVSDPEASRTAASGRAVRQAASASRKRRETAAGFGLDAGDDANLDDQYEQQGDSQTHENLDEIDSPCRAKRMRRTAAAEDDADAEAGPDVGLEADADAAADDGGDVQMAGGDEGSTTAAAATSRCKKAASAAANGANKGAANSAGSYSKPVSRREKEQQWYANRKDAMGAFTVRQITDYLNDGMQEAIQISADAFTQGSKHIAEGILRGFAACGTAVGQAIAALAQSQQQQHQHFPQGPLDFVGQLGYGPQYYPGGSQYCQHATWQGPHAVAAPPPGAAAAGPGGASNQYYQPVQQFFQQPLNPTATTAGAHAPATAGAALSGQGGASSQFQQPGQQFY